MKKGLLMSLVLVVMVGLLCGCGSDSKSNGSKGNAAAGSNGGSTTSIEGLYVSNVDTVEAVFVKEIENKYALVFKVSGMSYFQVVDVESDTVINGNLGEETYKISKNGDNIKLDFSMEGVKDLSLTRLNSNDAYGVYRDEYRFVAIYKDYNGDTKAFYYDAQKEKFSYLNPTSSEVKSDKAIIKASTKNLTITVSKDGNGYNVAVTGSYGEWGSAPGTYEKIF